MTTSEIGLPADASPEDVVETLRRHGIAQLRGAVEPAVLERLGAEFERALDEGDRGIDSRHAHPTNRGGRVARATTRELDPERFAASRALWLSPRFHAIARAYYAPFAVHVNDRLFFTHELPSESEILPWHFDRTQSLKFWVYLLDCPREAGAFEYALGSHNEGHFRANYYLLKGVEPSAIPNDVPSDEVRNATCIEGAAGDLVIFDSDGFHKGGTVQPGQERRVIRGHCHPVAASALASGAARRVLSRIQHLWSPLSGALERVVGDRVRTRAEKSRADVYAPIGPGPGSRQGEH